MPRGLTNCGNSCYLNCAVQTLFHVPPLTRRLRDGGYAGACPVTAEYARVVQELLRPDDESAVDSLPLLRAFRQRFPAFDNRRQHDAAEALVLLVDVLEESLGKEYVDQLFGGVSTQTVTFLKPSATSPCSVSRRHQPFVSLTLPVTEPGFSVDELLDQMAEPSAVYDYVDDDGEVHVVAMCATELTRVPAACILVFGSHNAHFNVRLPLEWRGMRLRSFVVHQGGDGSGHYVFAGRAKGSWVAKSDEHVEVVDQSEMSGDEVSAPAYIGVYVSPHA